MGYNGDIKGIHWDIIYIHYEGTWRSSCFESVKRVHFPGPQEAMLTSCALAACRLYNAYVRKLFCVHLGNLGEVCGMHLLPCIPSARFGIYCYSIRPKREKGRNPLFTCGFEGRNRDVRGA